MTHDKYSAARNDSCLTSLQNLVKKNHQQGYDNTAKQGGFRDTKTDLEKCPYVVFKMCLKTSFSKECLTEETV